MSLDDVCFRPPSVLRMPKVVRDLLWTVTSPHMLSGDRFPVLPAEFGVEALKFDVVIDWLKALVEDPTPLLTFLQEMTSNGRSLALGVYFSTLLEFWLRFCPHLGMQKMEIGKQIVSSTNRTVGQLKFLFRCNFQNGGKQRDFHDFHVESSVKFFLLNPIDSTTNGENCTGNDEANGENGNIPLEQYVGPHLGENLAWRVQEVDRKLAMRRGESVRAWLEENYSDIVQSHIVLRGYLFEPLTHFVSTSETSIAHDWSFHRNPAKVTNEMKACLNPNIATDHLRGWWTTDMETDLPAKVRANNQATIGESRFVILPKLHWLCPVVAVEDKTSGQVIVESDNRLDIPEVGALTLEELIVFVRRHFQKVTPSTQTNKSGGVAMPLLVAEIVQFSKEVEDRTQHWYELSRGFIFDPKCWDPSPLCHEPVRFRRTLRRNDATGAGEREYGARRSDCADEGFIKPDVNEATTQEKNRHQFTDLASIGPRELCQELVSVLSAADVLFTHGDLKRSTRELLLWRKRNCGGAPGYGGEETSYLRACLEFLVFGVNGEDESKHTRRVGYLLLDAFDGLNREFGLDKTAKSSSKECSDWTTLLAEVARDSERWEFLNLVLRAIDLTLNSTDTVQWGESERSSKFSFLDKLLAARDCRWNSVVVEAIRVFRIGKAIAGGHKVQSIFDGFIEQHDWQSAERLATVVQDPDMIQTLFKNLSLLHMTKALKRLQKVAAGFQSYSVSTSTERPSANDNTSPPIDHAKNLSLNKVNKLGLKWKYVDSIEEIEEVLERLKKLESNIPHAEDKSDEQAVAWNMLVGIDCEWRPQFLMKEQALTSNGTGNADELCDEDHEGLSIYQLAVGDIVYVVDVQVLGAAAAAPLSFIWRSLSPLRLIGFCVSSDIQRIKNSFPELEVHFDNSSETRHRSAPLLLELKELALFRHVPAKHWGLSRLYRECLGEKMDKEQQCSDWGSRPLSTSQLEYAAKDAYAVQRLSLHLLADVSFYKARAENCSISECLREFMKCFDASRNFSHSWTMESVSQPLGKQHVKAALQALGLEPRFLKCDNSEQEGLLVKSIALLIRREKQVNAPRRITYAVAVLPLDRSIAMEALGALLDADSDDISLADQETLVRVFGYSRGCLGPIGLREQQITHIIMDKCLQTEEYLLCGAGIAGEVYAIAPAELMGAVGALVARISRYL
ncbi:hypothetical protein PC123_g16593 [Phytophthora cactorum]|nr:hypothetical protein PC120_g16415 [Phytophthora cactorum]KAG4048085.1 hypothetical protein PC123_g16593 [Phytophthora cactorum]